MLFNENKLTASAPPGEKKFAAGGLHRYPPRAQTIPDFWDLYLSSPAGDPAPSQGGAAGAAVVGVAVPRFLARKASMRE